MPGSRKGSFEVHDHKLKVGTVRGVGCVCVCCCSKFCELIKFYSFMVFSSFIFLLIFCLDVLSIIERGVEVSNFEFVSFSLKFYQVLHHIFCGSAVR